MPLAVVVSAGLASTSTRSARGFTLTDMMKIFNRLIDFLNCECAVVTFYAKA
jgi:hypothetical protein